MAGIYLSRLAFSTVPGKAGDVERALARLRNPVEAAGDEFQAWSREVSALLAQSPKREVYLSL